MSLVNYEIKLILTWSANCVISEIYRAATFIVIDTTPEISFVTLSTEGNVKLFQPLKPGIKRRISWNEYQ